MSIRGEIRGMFRQLGRDLTPDYEAIRLAQANRERGTFGQAEKPAIIIEARCGRRPLRSQLREDFFAGIVTSAGDACGISVEELERQEALRSRKEAGEKAQISMLKGDRKKYGNHRGHRAGRKPRAKDHRSYELV